MITILLSVLKFMGIFLLTVLCLLLLVLLLVLFVPVRYHVLVKRKLPEDNPLTAQIKVSWLLHILNLGFFYPEAAYLRVRVFCFTIFRSDKPGRSSKTPSGRKKDRSADARRKGKETEKTAEEPKQAKQEEPARQQKQMEDQDLVWNNSRTKEQRPKEEQSQRADEEEKKETPLSFLKRLFQVLINIKYTICKIYDKIKDVISNIRYYIRVIQSDTFSRAWTLCSGQVFSLLKNILPGKLDGELLIGTGDPAGTGQVLAIYGMLYPLIGSHIDVKPDFERQILEGRLFLKGKITVFRAVKTAWIIYFNKDMRRLIKLLKREAA